jgi:hypothetical protein
LILIKIEEIEVMSPQFSFIVSILVLPNFTRWAGFILALLIGIYFIKSRQDILEERADKFFMILRIGLYGFAVFLICRGVTLALAQYLVWKKANPALLPPHYPIGYFLGYAWMHFLKAAVFSIAFPLLLLFIMALANRFSRGRFFYREEPWLAAFGAMTASWPAGIIVMAAVLVIGVLMQVVFTIKGLRSRMPLLYFWLPSALIAILFGDIIGKWIGLNNLRV